MKALVLGGGGREHALAWKLAQSPLVQTVYVAPGNGGTATDKRLENIAITDVVALREWAQDHQIDITVVGPEGLLAAGVVDQFRAHGLRVFGPTQAAAQLEPPPDPSAEDGADHVALSRCLREAGDHARQRRLQQPRRGYAQHHHLLHEPHERQRRRAGRQAPVAPRLRREFAVAPRDEREQAPGREALEEVGEPLVEHERAAAFDHMRVRSGVDVAFVELRKGVIAARAAVRCGEHGRADGQ